MDCFNVKDKNGEYETNQTVYDSIKKLHVKLSKTDLTMLIHQFAISLHRYESLALSLFSVRKYLYILYSNRVLDGLATSTISKQFNMSKKGHNKEVASQVDNHFKEAYRLDVLLDPMAAAFELKKVGLRHEILYSPRVEGLVREANLTDAIVELERTRQYREVLFVSCLKMAAKLAKKRMRPLMGGITEEVDLIQEAIAAVREGVNNYEPTLDGLTFTTYMYNCVAGSLSKFINEHTRTVSLPRSVIDRYSLVSCAIEELGSSYNVELVTEKANKLLVESNRSAAKYTKKEVTLLLMCTKGTASLDVEIGDYNDLSNTDEAHTLYDLLSDEESRTQGEELDSRLANRRIMEVVKEYTTPEEYTVMELRWGMGKVKGLKAVANEYKVARGIAVNKGKVAEIEQRVLGRLRRAIEEGDDRLVQIFESI